MAEIARVEVYIDGQEQPFQVLKQAPFQVRLNPADFAAGDHFMQVYVHYTNGDTHHYIYRFTVTKEHRTYAGYLNRAPVGAPIDVVLLDPSEAEIAVARPSTFTHGVLPALLFVLIAGIATWFSFLGENPVKDYVEHTEPIAAASVGGAQDAAPAAAGEADGAAIYAQHCATCHGPEGQGQGEVFPALAGNPNLADTQMVVDVVLHGRPGTAMPPWGQQLSDEEIAAVVNYILSAWGNDFGQISVDDIAAQR